jgi:hypothetical protein
LPAVAGRNSSPLMREKKSRKSRDREDRREGGEKREEIRDE